MPFLTPTLRPLALPSGRASCCTSGPFVIRFEREGYGVILTIPSGIGPLVFSGNCGITMFAL